MFPEHVAQRAHAAFGIDDAAGVVGRVDYYRLSLGREGASERRDVDVERAVARFYLYKLRSRLRGKYRVFGEAGNESYHLVPLVAQRAQRYGYGGSRAARHINIVFGYVVAEVCVDIFRDRPAHARRALRRSVAVQVYGVGIFYKSEHYLFKLRGRRNAGIAEGEIEHLVLADFSLAGVAVFKQLPYNGADFT